jgi:cysteine synthase
LTILVEDDSAFLHAERLAAEEGILAGVSSGAARAAAHSRSRGATHGRIVMRLYRA